MEETVIVIMLKDKETGFLDKELGSYKVESNETMIYNTFASEKEDGTYEVTMKLTCDRDVEDWEFEAIYDYYDSETLMPAITSIIEEEDCFNPTWSITFDFIENVEDMENKISEILALHVQELNSVYEAIADKKDEY